MASTFGSTVPLSSTHWWWPQNWVRLCGITFQDFCSKNANDPSPLLPRPRALPCCIFPLPLGEQIAFFFNWDCLTTTLIGACRAALPVYIVMGVVAPQERGHHHACRNLCWNWCEGISWWSTPPLYDGDDPLNMELWMGPTLADAILCLAPLHISRAPPAQLVMRDPQLMSLKPSAIHLFLLIATPSIHHGFSFPIRNQNCQLLTVQVRLAKYFFSNSPSVSFPYSVVCIPPIPLTSPSIYSHLLMLLDNSSMWLKAELFFWNTSIT